MDHVANTNTTNVNGPNNIDLDFDGATKTCENIFNVEFSNLHNNLMDVLKLLLYYMVCK
jgi:hypothetical protein